MAGAEKHALITGSSRGIGRGIALALADRGVKVAIHYYRNEPAAIETLAQVQRRGCDGFLVQADVTRPEQIVDMFRKVQAAFGKLEIFVSNARPEAPAFFEPPLDITLAQWDTALDSQRRRFSSAFAKRLRSWETEGESSRSRMPKGAARVGCNPGWAWVRRKRHWSRWSVISPSPLRSAVSP